MNFFQKHNGLNSNHSNLVHFKMIEIHVKLEMKAVDTSTFKLASWPNYLYVFIFKTSPKLDWIKRLQVSISHSLGTSWNSSSLYLHVDTGNNLFGEKGCSCLIKANWNLLKEINLGILYNINRHYPGRSRLSLDT